MQHFQSEQAVFNRLRARLAQSHEGEYAVVCGDRLVGVYTTSREAYRAGMLAAGLDTPFMMQRIEARPLAGYVHHVR